MEGEPTQYQLIDPESPEPMLPEFDWVSWLPWLGILLLLVALVALIIRKLTRPKPIPVNRAAEAYEKAVQSLSQCSPASAHQAAIDASLILRRYLADAIQDPALFETHEEFIARYHALSSLEEGTLQQLADTFTQLAALKYRLRDSDAEAASIIDQSRSLLKTINREFTT